MQAGPGSLLHPPTDRLLTSILNSSAMQIIESVETRTSNADTLAFSHLRPRAQLPRVQRAYLAVKQSAWQHAPRVAIAEVARFRSYIVPSLTKYGLSRNHTRLQDTKVVR
jgi:hypothetical protein